MVYETNNARGLYITNLFVGVLNKDYIGKLYLLASKQLNKTNNETISQLINDFKIIMDRCKYGTMCITLVDRLCTIHCEIRKIFKVIFILTWYI